MKHIFIEFSSLISYFAIEKEKEKVLVLEKEKRKLELLKQEEETWRQKSRIN